MDDIEKYLKLIFIAVPKLRELKDVEKVTNLIAELDVKTKKHFEFVKKENDGEKPKRKRKKLTDLQKKADRERKTPKPSKFVFASKNQSEMKSVNQCASMAVLSLLACHLNPQIENWDRKFIDEFMEAADNTHNQILKAKGLQMGDYLDGGDFRGHTISLMNRQFVVNVESTNAFTGEKKSLDAMSVTFEEQMEQLLNENGKAMLVTGAKST
jgi:hypothetical protein